jgi:hypothetical protein
MHRSAAVLLLCLAACGPFFRPGGEPASTPQVLCVENAAVAYGNLIAHAGPVRFDVMPGQQVCKRVMGTGAYVALRAVTTGGGLRGPRSYAERLPIGGYDCWRWRLTDSPASSADLGPCPRPAEEDTVPADSPRAAHR